MSTRATYEFKDDNESLTVYKHFDGYPEGGIRWIKNAIKYAWPLPRFEPGDFAAAFIAANKLEGGDVRCTHSRDSHSDTEYHYTITYNNGLMIIIENLATCDIECGTIGEFVKKFNILPLKSRYLVYNGVIGETK